MPGRGRGLWSLHQHSASVGAMQGRGVSALSDELEKMVSFVCSHSNVGCFGVFF